MLYLLTSSNSFPHQKIEKVRVINLTQGGLKAMEELEKLEEDRRNENVGVMLDKKRSGRRKERRSAMPKGTASNEMCTFLILYPLMISITCHNAHNPIMNTSAIFFNENHLTLSIILQNIIATTVLTIVATIAGPTIAAGFTLPY